MTEHDLSALHGFLDDLDIVENGNEDPRAAKLKALFEHAKATYTAKIDTPTWYISPATPSITTNRFDLATFTIPSPNDLLAQRKADRTGTTNQEWTANYLYTEGHFEKCLSYAASFALSMGIDFPFAEGGKKEEEGDYDSSQMALQRSKAEREMSKNWGVVKDVVDSGVRSLLSLLRTSFLTSIETWVPSSSSSNKTHQLEKVDLNILARGFLAFSMREIRVGAGDSRSGYSGMVLPPTAPSSFPSVDMEKVKLQNWTVTHGLALTAGDLALELGLYRTAIEAHTLFLACRGQMWRVLLSLAHEVSRYAQALSAQNRASEKSIKALEIVAKAAVVSALQAVPRPRRVELAKGVIVEHKVIPKEWIGRALKGGEEEEAVLKAEDELLFKGLLQNVTGDQGGKQWPVVPEEIGIALVKVVFAKKSGLFAIYQKFPTYIREYKGRLDAAVAYRNEAQEWGGELDAAEEEESENGPRSVRTL